MTKTFTHKGCLFGDNRVGGRTPLVRLRETKNFWVDRTGRKFRKENGSGMGDWALWSLDIKSVEKLDEPVEL